MLTTEQLARLRAEPGTNRVAAARALAGVTQVTVAAAVGLPQPYVSDVARRRYRTITVENATSSRPTSGAPSRTCSPLDRRAAPRDLRVRDARYAAVTLAATTAKSSNAYGSFRPRCSRWGRVVVVSAPASGGAIRCDAAWPPAPTRQPYARSPPHHGCERSSPRCSNPLMADSIAGSARPQLRIQCLRFLHHRHCYVYILALPQELVVKDEGVSRI